MAFEPYNISLIYLGRGILVPSHQDLFALQIQRPGGLTGIELDLCLEYGTGSLDHITDGLLYICKVEPPSFQDIFILTINSKTRLKLRETLVKNLEKLIHYHNTQYGLPPS